MIKSVVNSDGLLVELAVFTGENGSAIGYALPENTRLVDYLNDALTVTNGIHHPPLKPRWDGAAWTDEATAEELAAAFPPTEPPTDAVNDRLDALESLIVDTQYQLALTQLGLSGEV